MKKKIQILLLAVALVLMSINLSGCLFLMLDFADSDSSIMSDDSISTQEKTTTTTTTANTTTTTTTASIGTKTNPYVLTAEQLANEIINDKESAAQKYNGRWVKITGKITDTSDGGIMYGYYLYGKRSTTGYTGLRIVCWRDGGIYKGGMIGSTYTFLGVLREVTTVNAIEIGECTIIE